MTARIIGIGVVFLLLVLGVAHAQETEQSIENYLSGSAEATTLNGLPNEYQEFAEDAFARFLDETPPEHLDAHTKWLVGILKQHHSESHTMSLPGWIADLFAVPGYSSALTGLLVGGGAEKLIATVATDGRYARSTCSWCMVTTATLLKPTSQGWHWVVGQHQAKNPTTIPVTTLARVHVP